MLFTSVPYLHALFKSPGGYTIRVLRKRMSAEDGTEFDRQMKFKL